MKVYLKNFSFLSREKEERFFDPNHRSFKTKNYRTCYTTKYPFGVFRYRELPRFEFEPITIFYGGNGSGKTTLLNIIAEKLNIDRGAIYNRSDYFEDYVELCSYQMSVPALPRESKIITSDDVFDYLLDVRYMNEGIDIKRNDIFDDYVSLRRSKEEELQLKGFDDYKRWKEVHDAFNSSQSQFVKQRLMRNIEERSNGESAMVYFTDSIKENALYLLDEPENSLSAEMQIELKKFLESSARFFGCQFIISTHSPFLLSITNAKIYNLDNVPPDIVRWTQLPNVKAYYELFKDCENDFKEEYK